MFHGGPILWLVGHPIPRAVPPAVPTDGPSAVCHFEGLGDISDDSAYCDVVECYGAVGEELGDFSCLPDVAGADGQDDIENVPVGIWITVLVLGLGVAKAVFLYLLHPLGGDDRHPSGDGVAAVCVVGGVCIHGVILTLDSSLVKPLLVLHTIPMKQLHELNAPPAEGTLLSWYGTTTAATFDWTPAAYQRQYFEQMYVGRPEPQRDQMERLQREMQQLRREVDMYREYAYRAARLTEPK